MRATITCETPGRGLHDVTDQVRQVVRGSGVQSGLCHVFVRHTSASLVIQENADPSARRDLEAFFDRLVPDDDARYTHTDEGPDDMPSHIRAALTRSSETLIVAAATSCSAPGRASSSSSIAARPTGASSRSRFSRIASPHERGRARSQAPLVSEAPLPGPHGDGFGARPRHIVGRGRGERAGLDGEVFLQALKMVIVPLVLTSLTSGVASIGTGRELGRIGAKTLGYYVLSSLLAILVGLFFVNLIKPGVGAQIAGATATARPEIMPRSGPLQLILDFIPANPFQAMAETQMLGVIGFSIFLGIAIAHLPEEPRAGARRAVERRPSR